MICICVQSLVILSLVLLLRLTYANSSDDVTADVFGTLNVDMFPAAIGDYDSDRIMDTIFLAKNASFFQVYFGNATVPLLKPRPGFQCDLSSLDVDGMPAQIVGLALADFTGDGVLDVLVTLNQQTYVVIYIFKGDTRRLDCKTSALHIGGSDPYLRLKQEPLIIDWNGDMVADIFGELYNQKGRKLWVFNGKPDPVTVHFPCRQHTCLPMLTPHSNAYGDLDGDFSPEFIIISKAEENSTHYLEAHSIGDLKDSDPVFNHILHVIVRVGELNPERIGSLVLADVNQTGKVLPLIPYCMDRECRDSGILLFDNDFKVLDVKFTDSQNRKWGFFVPDTHTPYAETITLRVGDFDLDGYPDLIGTVSYSGEHGHSSKAVIFFNVPCVRKECNYSRTFSLNFELLTAFDNTVSAVFYDFYDNGLLDVMLLQKLDTKNNATKVVETSYKVQALLNTPKYDGYFIKWMMTSGHCQKPHCPPYGAVLPGASMNYTMMNQKGFPQVCKSAQFFRSSFFAMDLPFVVIGTGSTPNFIDTVWIGKSESKKRINVQKWRQIIPNSHLVVIPYSKGWELKHFLSTNREGAISTLQALVLILFINGVIVFLFWLKERKEDRKNVQMSGSLNFIRLS